jgi:hypothetical protein
VKPETPLPWVLDEFAEEFGPEGLGIGGVHGSIRERQENGAYLVHAANAYPRLVDAVRTLAMLNGTARALLVELGEYPAAGTPGGAE